jgi:DNA polymerase III epsilon subunit-like protein
MTPLVDIETTGLHILQDKITEIAVIILSEEGVEGGGQFSLIQTIHHPSNGDFNCLSG